MPSNSRNRLNDYLSQMSVIGGSVAEIGTEDNRVGSHLSQFSPASYVTFEKDHASKLKYDADDILDLSYMTVERGSKHFEQYDYVFCLEVFEYLSNLPLAASNLYNLTKRGGKLIASWVFVYPQHGMEDMSRWTDYAANQVFRNAGFTDISIIERKAKDIGLIKSFYTSEGFHCPELRDPEYGYPVGFIMECEK